jgi:tRNA(fMet)-specific endonuclease VapC
MIYVLDTDHISLDQHAHPVVSARINAHAPEEIAVSVISLEEQVRGWLAVLRAAKTSTARCQAYIRLRMTIEYFASIQLLDYDLAADDLYEQMRRQGVRIGTQDLRIAAIVLRHNGTLVTRNSRDFGQVPGLILEDWSAE